MGREPSPRSGYSIHTISWREREGGRWPKACVWLSKEARRCGANPSPRSWPRICSCKCSGWHFEEMPGEVRPAGGRFSKKARTSRRRTRRRWTCASSSHRPAMSRTSPDLASRGHPKHLLRKCGASYVERDSHRIVALTPEMCAHDSHEVGRVAFRRNDGWGAARCCNLPEFTKPKPVQTLRSVRRQQRATPPAFALANASRPDIVGPPPHFLRKC